MPPVFQRALLQLSVVVRTGRGLEQVNTPIEPDSFHIQRRGHSHAASCDFTIRGGALPFDPDHFESGFVAVFFADVGRRDGQVNKREFIRFVGWVDELKRNDDERGPFIEGKARDLSALLRDLPAVAIEAIPRYEDTLAQALQRLIDSRLGGLTGPQGEDLGDTLTLRMTDALASASLASLVGAPHKRGRIPMPKADCTTWEAMEVVCDMAARLITVDLQEVVVRLPAEAVGDDTPDAEKPAVIFLFGAEDSVLPNATAPIVPARRVTRMRKLVRQRRGVFAVSWDPVKRQRISAVYPPTAGLPPLKLPRLATERGAAQAQIKAARQAASQRTPQPGRDVKGRYVNAEQRDIFTLGHIHTQSGLEEAVKSIYLQRSRQEMEGSVETHEIPNAVLNLQNGSRFGLRVAPGVEIELSKLQTDEERIRYLVYRLGMDEKAAAVLLRAYDQPRQTLFYAKAPSIAYEKGSVPTVAVEFLNLVTIRVAS